MSAASERVRRVNREREQRMVANALKWKPGIEAQPANSALWESQRVAIAEHLAKEGK